MDPQEGMEVYKAWDKTANYPEASVENAKRRGAVESD